MVQKKTLITIAGMVWFAAGFNVARLGILDYMHIPVIHVAYILLSVLVFCIFGCMFYRMSKKHTKRILEYGKETQPIWRFFDAKSYGIMAFMMGGGIWLRSSGLAPEQFIAVFYTGLGCALALAGILFLYYRYISLVSKKNVV